MLSVNGSVRVVSHGDLKQTKNGKDMGIVTVASTRVYTSADGTQNEDTTFITVFGFGKLARSVATRIPGELLAIEGELNSRDNVSERHARLDEHGRVEKVGVQFRNYTVTARNVEYLTTKDQRATFIQKHGLPAWVAQESTPDLDAEAPELDDAAVDEALADAQG